MRKRIRIWIPVIFLLLVIAGMGYFCQYYAQSKIPAQEDKIRNELRKELRGQENIIDYAIEGNTAYTFISSTGRSDYGDTFVVFWQEEGSWSRIYTNDFMNLRPWKLELADVDGDGITDIVSAVQKSVYYDKRMKNRLFIFNYEEGRLVKKWTGSQIAGIWSDFLTGDLLPVKGDEVIFLSQTENGGERLEIYSWFDLGFLLLAKSQEYENITSLEIQGENCMKITSGSVGNNEIFLTVEKGKIVRSIFQSAKSMESAFR